MMQQAIEPVNGYRAELKPPQKRKYDEKKRWASLRLGSKTFSTVKPGEMFTIQNFAAEENFIEFKLFFSNELQNI